MNPPTLPALKKKLLKLLSLALLPILLLNPSLSARGAADGLTLWFNVVFPTLFPFLFAMGLVTASGALPLAAAPAKYLLGPLFSFNSAGCFALLSGLLCGYPVGARQTAVLMRQGFITARQGAALFSVCAYPSPMFLAGYVLPLMETAPGFWRLFLSLTLPAVPMAAAARRIYGASPADEIQPPAGAISVSESPAGTAGPPADFNSVLMDSLEIMEKICGCLMVFSVAAAFWNRYMPDTFGPKVFLLSLTEMTVGIREIAACRSGIFQSALARDTAMVAAAAFGGLSGAAQTQTVIKNAGLSIRHYMAWKWVHMTLSSLTFILLSSLRLPPPAQ